MKWTYHIGQKIKIGISLTIIIVMVLMTNFLNKRCFEELQRSFSSVYEDRLLVEVHIYKITTFLNYKNILLHERGEKSVIPIHTQFRQINDSISTHIQAYNKTLFITEEAEIFGELKSNIAQLSAMEDSILMLDENADIHGQLMRTNKKHAVLSSNLSQLSNIQREEGGRLTNKSKQIIASSKITLQFELVILIIIGIILQALIFSSKSTLPRIHQNPSLN